MAFPIKLRRPLNGLKTAPIRPEDGPETASRRLQNGLKMAYNIVTFNSCFKPFVGCAGLETARFISFISGRFEAVTAHKQARFCVDTGRLMSCDSLKTARFKCVLSRHNVDSHKSNYKAPCTSGKSRPCIELLEHIPPDEHVEQVKLTFFNKRWDYLLNHFLKNV